MKYETIALGIGLVGLMIMTVSVIISKEKQKGY